MNRLFLIALLLFNVIISKGQEWQLELSSSVELRTLKLTNKAEKITRPLGGAIITLYQGQKVVNSTQSDGNGDFIIFVPGNGDYIVVVSYQDCNAKKFEISTKVPPKFNTENWKPTFSIEGVIMAKPLYSINYSALKRPLARITFMNDSKKIDDDEVYTEQILDELKKLKESEDILVDKFITAVRAGDAALKKPDCPLAKAMYEQALSLIPGEQYPIEQLLKVGLCLKDTENAVKVQAEKKAAEEKALAAKKAKEAEEQLALEKAEKAASEAEKNNKEAAKIAREKEERLAKEKAENEKTQKEQAEKLAKQQAKQAEEETLKNKKEAEKKEREKELSAKEQELIKRREKELAAEAAKNKELAEKAVAAKQEEEKKALEKEVAAKQATKKPVAKTEATVEAEKNKKPKAENEPVVSKKPVEKKTGEKEKKDAYVPEEKIVSKDFEPDSRNSKSRRKKRHSSYSTPRIIGSNKYEDIIKKADAFYTEQKYDEAKREYEAALKLKLGDAYASSRISEINAKNKR